MTAGRLWALGDAGIYPMCHCGYEQCSHKYVESMDIKWEDVISVLDAPEYHDNGEMPMDGILGPTS